MEVDELAAFLRVINTIENLRSATGYFVRAQAAKTPDAMTRLIELGRHDLDDAVRVLEEGELHLEALPVLATSIASADQAFQTAQDASFKCGAYRLGGASMRLDDAILDAVVARDLMVTGPIQQLPDPIAVLDEPSSPDDPPTPPPPIAGHTCTVYGCSATPDPDPPVPGELPDPTSPPNGNSAEGSAFGPVVGLDLDASTITIQTDAGNVTLQVTTATVFKGTVASSLSDEADASFFLVTNEVESLEANFPDVF